MRSTKPQWGSSFSISLTQRCRITTMRLQWRKNDQITVSGPDCPNAILVCIFIKDCVWTSSLETFITDTTFLNWDFHLLNLSTNWGFCYISLRQLYTSKLPFIFTEIVIGAHFFSCMFINSCSVFSECVENIVYLKARKTLEKTLAQKTKQTIRNIFTQLNYKLQFVEIAECTLFPNILRIK